MDHVLTQLPYAAAAAAAALVGYVVLAVSGSTWLGLLTTLAGVAVLVAAARAGRPPVEEHPEVVESVRVAA